MPQSLLLRVSFLLSHFNLQELFLSVLLLFNNTLFLVRMPSLIPLSMLMVIILKFSSPCIVFVSFKFVCSDFFLSYERFPQMSVDPLLSVYSLT